MFPPFRKKREKNEGRQEELPYDLSLHKINKEYMVEIMIRR
jgi:hypothetical protein